MISWHDNLLVGARHVPSWHWTSSGLQCWLGVEGVMVGSEEEVEPAPSGRVSQMSSPRLNLEYLNYADILNNVTKSHPQQ